MKLSTLYSKTRKAIGEFSMIDENDHVALALSGGKDSLTLLYALSGLSHVMNFRLSAILVDLGYENFSTEGIENLCRELDVPFYRIRTEIGDVIFSRRKEKNPCAMCAKMRKGVINRKAVELGCSRIAYGHNRDDFTDTFLMSMFSEGQLKTLLPEFHLSRSGLHLIRPLMYVTEKEIIEFAARYNLPIEKNPCPADGITARQKTRDIISRIKEDFPDAEDKMFSIIRKKGYFA